jgi:hypothetical protein
LLLPTAICPAHPERVRYTTASAPRSRRSSIPPSYATPSPMYPTSDAHDNGPACNRLLLRHPQATTGRPGSTSACRSSAVRRGAWTSCRRPRHPSPVTAAAGRCAVAPASRPRSTHAPSRGATPRAPHSHTRPRLGDHLCSWIAAAHERALLAGACRRGMRLARIATAGFAPALPRLRVAAPATPLRPPCPERDPSIAQHVASICTSASYSVCVTDRRQRTLTSTQSVAYVHQ